MNPSDDFFSATLGPDDLDFTTPDDFDPISGALFAEDTPEPFNSQDFFAMPEEFNTFIPKQGLLASGVDKGQEMMWSGIDTAARAAGLTTPEWLQERIDENAAGAAMSEPETFLENVAYAAGQVGPMALGTGAAALLAPAVGASSGLAAMVAGTTMGLASTVGDVRAKTEGLDPDSKAYMEEVLAGGAWGMLDVVGLGKARKVLAPLKELMADVTEETLKRNQGWKKGTKDILTSAAQIGAAEGMQDIGTGVSANVITGQEIDQSRVIALAKSGVEEAAIGMILGAPLSSANIAARSAAERQAEKDIETLEAVREDAKIQKAFMEGDQTVDEAFEDAHYQRTGNSTEAEYNLHDLQTPDGELNPSAVKYRPLHGADENVGLFARLAHVVTGNITDPIKDKVGGNNAAMTFLQQINLKAQERRPGKSTIQEKSNVRKGLVKNRLGKAFFEAPDSEAEAALQRKREGKADPENPVDVAIHNMLHGDDLKADILNASRGKIDPSDPESLWMDETYTPYDLSWEELSKSATWREDLAAAMEGQPEGHLEKSINIIEQGIQDYREFGNNMSLTSYRQNAYEGVLRKMTDQERTNPDSLRRTIERMKSEPLPNIASPLTIERALKEVPETFLNKFSAGTSAKELLAGHVDKQSEHLSHMEVFGQNNELAYELIAEAVVEGADKGQPLTPKIIDDMLDALRVSQRIHLRPISQEWRDRQATAQGILNTQLLGLSALVSIPEALTIPLNSSIRSAVKGLGDTMKFGKDNKNYDSLSPEEKRRVMTANTDLNLNLNNAMQLTANRTNQDTVNMKSWEHVFIRYFTGLPFMQHFLSTWAVKAMDTDNRRLIAESRSPTSTAAQKNRALVELSDRAIDVDKMAKWADSDYDMESGYFLNEYLPSLLAQTRDTIVDPDPIDKPAWQNYEALKLVSQLKGFMTVFTNRTMRGQKARLRNLTGANQNRELALKVAPYTAAYLLAQMGIGMLREVLKSGEVDDEKTVAMRGWNAFGYLGANAYFVDMANAMLWRSDPLASAGGPAVSIGLDLAGASVRSIAEMDPEEIVTSIIRRGIPNTIGKGAVVEVINEAVGYGNN